MPVSEVKSGLSVRGSSDCGTTSVTVEVDVQAERYTTGETVAVTSASLVMVAVNEFGQKIAFAGPRV